MIRGSLVTLRPAEDRDRRAVHEWMAQSDVTPSMMGPPVYGEAPIPTWEEFCADYVPLYFDGSRPEVGRSYVIELAGQPVGHVSYSDVDISQGIVEMDIWLGSEATCGRGLGTDALVALSNHLRDTLGLKEFIIRPSRRNQRAVRAYAKAGFVLLPLTTQEQAAIYGPGDHHDTVAMRKEAESSRGSVKR
jgi:diamine N-acetyltransferase